MKRGGAWEEAGRRIAPALDMHSSALILGEDPIAAAQVALGIAREQGLTRRVAVGDLVGDLEPLALAAPGETTDGIAESLVHGISFDRIARPVTGEERVYVLPSGADAIAREEIFAHPRWQRLTAGFREVGALLLLVAPADAPGLASLAKATDGAVLVEAPPVPEGVKILASVRSPRPSVPRATAPRRRRSRWFGGGVAGMIVVLLGVLLFMQRDAGDAVAVDTLLVSDPEPVAAPQAVPLREPLSAPANVADSASAAAYAVELVAANTETGANLRLTNEAALPAGTFSPVALEDGSLWYKVIAGAYTTSGGAEALLVRLRARGALGNDAGAVVRAPFALAVARWIPPAAATDSLRRYREIGLPVYGLVQDDGTVHLYAGAFETPQGATLLAEALESAGLVPAVVYRTGRPF